MPEILRIGLDIGSTTIKCVVLDEADKIIYSCYERHLSLIAQKTRELLTRLDNEVVHGAPVRLSISGSAGMGGRMPCCDRIFSKASSWFSSSVMRFFRD